MAKKKNKSESDIHNESPEIILSDSERILSFLKTQNIDHLAHPLYRDCERLAFAYWRFISKAEEVAVDIPVKEIDALKNEIKPILESYLKGELS